MASAACVQGLPLWVLLKRYQRFSWLGPVTLAEHAGYSIGHISNVGRSARFSSLTAIDLLAGALALDASDLAA